MDNGNWNNIGTRIERADIQMHYGDDQMPMKLRVLGAKNLWKGFYACLKGSLRSSMKD